MKNYSSKQAKACTISKKVKNIVYKRDKNGICIICHSNQGIPNAHFISRAKGGLGIEQNIVTLCKECHRLYDGVMRKEYRDLIHKYLLSKYPDLQIENLIYKKWNAWYKRFKGYTIDYTKNK